MGGQAALQEGLGHYIGQPGRYRGWVLSMGGCAVGLDYLSLRIFLPSLEWRIICYSVMSACLCIPGVLMLRKNGKQEEAPKRFFARNFFREHGNYGDSCCGCFCGAFIAGIAGADKFVAYFAIGWTALCVCCIVVGHCFG